MLLENFGIYARQKFDFDQAPLVLVYGPNESGKTTTLNGLRNALFGFPTRSGYLTGKPMSAEVVGRLADGTTLQFSRKKARKDEVVGKCGARRLTGEEVHALLGKMDLETYQQLFGFSLDELREGEQALKNAKLAEALAGGGMGGAHWLQQLRADLTNSVSGLFKARGGSQIGTLLNDIRSQQDSLRQLQTLPSAVDDLRLKLQQAIERGEEAKNHYAQLHLQVARAERLQQALPKLVELRRLEQALQATEVPEGVDATFVAQWSDYAQQLSKLHQMLQTETAQLQQEQQRLKALAGVQSMTGHEARVESLGHQAVEMPKLRERWKELQRQSAEAATNCARALQTLGMEAASEGVMNLSVSAPQRGELESWASEYDKACKDLLAVNVKLESIAEQLQHLRIHDSADLPDNLPVLRELIGKIAEEESLQEQLVESVCQKCESPEFEILGVRLRSRLPDCPPLEYSWPIPSSHDVARHLRLLEESQRQLAQWQREAQRLEHNLSVAQAELSELQGASEQSCWGELQAIARQRDQTIDGWLDELMEPLLAVSIGVEQQKMRLQQLKLIHERTDRLLQQLVDNAESLARVGQIKKQIVSLTAEKAELQANIEQHVASQQQLDHQWRSAWQGCPLEPLAPEAMTSWVADFEAWSRVSAELDIERRKLMTSRSKLKQWRNELLDAWPTIIEAEADVGVLRAQLDEWVQTASVQQSEQLRASATQKLQADLLQRQALLRKRQEELLDGYRRWLDQQQLPSDWPLAQVTLLVDTAERLKRDQRNHQRHEAQMHELRQRIDDFGRSVMELAETWAVKSDGALPESLAQGWLTQLQSDRKDAAERAKLLAAVEHRTSRIQEMTIRQVEIEDRLAVLSASVRAEQSPAGPLDRASFDALMQRAQQATEMRIQQNELLCALEAMAGGEPLEEFLAALRSCEANLLSVQLTELKRELSQCETLRQQIDQEFGALANQLDQVAQSETAQRQQQHLHTMRGQLSELAEQWVVGRLAQELLNRCIERFTHDHEPALLQLTHGFLNTLTGGKYAAVDYDATSPGGFVVRNALGEAFEPSRLSTGTREQLYLAIRMAYISHYAEQHEPLPVLMDDCLVNFDDLRSRLALQALLNWHGSIQTILLSCHGRSVQQLAELAPDTPVICLDRNSTHLARDLASELAPSI